MWIKRFFFNLINKKKKKVAIDIKKIKKILFIRHDRIGDMIVTSFLFREIKKAYPQIEISVLASPHNKTVLKYNPYIKKVFVYKKKPIEILKTIMNIRKEKYDIVCCVYELPSFTTTLMLRLFNGATNIGFYPNETNLLDYYIVKDYHNTHITEKYEEILKLLNINNYLTKYDFFIGESENKKYELFFKKNNTSKIILLNRYGGSSNRIMPVLLTKAVLFHIIKANDNLAVILTYTNENRTETEEIVRSIGSCKVMLSPKTDDIIDVGAVIKQVDAIVTVDTSIVHIGSSFNKPMTVLYMKHESNYNRWKPTSDYYETIFSDSSENYANIDINDFTEKIDRMIAKI